MKTRKVAAKRRADAARVTRPLRKLERQGRVEKDGSSGVLYGPQGPVASARRARCAQVPRGRLDAPPRVRRTEALGRRRDPRPTARAPLRGTYSIGLRASRNRDQITDVRCRSHAGHGFVTHWLECRRAMPWNVRRNVEDPIWGCSRSLLLERSLERWMGHRGTVVGRLARAALLHGTSRFCNARPLGALHPAFTARVAAYVSAAIWSR
jgi:hypothetical protein